MKKRGLFGYLCILTSMVLSSSSVSAQPGIRIPDESFDFGRAAQYAVVSHRFWIHSTGNEPLLITKVVPGCGCTEAPLRDSVIAPGDSTYLDLYFSTKSYRGYVKKRPYVETNIDAVQHYLLISAELLPEPDTVQPIHLSPSRLDVSQFKTKVRRKAGFWIVNTDTVDYKVTPVDHAVHAFDIELPAMVAAGDSAKGQITVTDGFVEKDFEESLTFEISDQNHTRYSLPVKRMYRVKE